MTFHIGDSSAYKTIVGGINGEGTAIAVGGSYKSVRSMWIGSSGAWKLFFTGGFTATLSRATWTDVKLDDYYGFRDTLGGSLSPDVLNGEGMRGIYTVNANQLFVEMDNVVSDSAFFESIECSLGTFTTASAIYSEVLGYSSWSWSVGTDFASSGTEEVNII